MKKGNWKALILIFIPVILGSIVGLLTSSFNSYQDLTLPSFAPPGWLFPVVWTILYLLMGISSYLIYTSNSLFRDEALAIYWLQLVVNLLWTVWFFVFNLRLFSFFWIILLIILVIIMIKRFYQISKTSAYLQIPYLFWLVFAGILNLTLYFLN